jgi:hypothetical protein
MRLRRPLGFLLAAVLFAGACSSDREQAAPSEPAEESPTQEASPSPTPEEATTEPDEGEPRGPKTVTVAAAGDISETEIGDQKATSDLVLGEEPDHVLVLGDAQYEEGSLEDFQDYYDPTWGRFEEKTFAAPGNHDVHDESGYDEYFDLPEAWYSVDVGRWHLISLDSNRPEHRSQINFLERDLAQDGRLCQLAFWHHPRWSSGSDHGSDDSIQPLWERVVAADVDLVLVGHEHVYERFDALDEAGRPAPDGTPQITVGTGGAEQHDDFFDAALPGSTKRIAQTHGVLFLELKRSSFAGEYRNVAGKVLDRFEDQCR